MLIYLDLIFLSHFVPEMINCLLPKIVITNLAKKNTLLASIYHSFFFASDEKKKGGENNRDDEKAPHLLECVSQHWYLFGLLMTA